MGKFAKGSYVFVEDDEDMYVAAKVEVDFENGKPGAVKLIDNDRSIRLSGPATKSVVAMDKQCLESHDDMVQLKQLDEPSILHNLRMRYMKDDIYTNIGTILVSMNPFKILPIYTPEVVDKYVKQGSAKLPPHVFGVADNAYRSLVDSGNDQSCIVSGESGAGKTEATKLFLQYIGEKSQGGDSKNSGKSMQLQEQILEANPLMEAFGNAKTVRNNNSSRFGKLVQVYMDNKRGQIIGGSITQYLLEKSRLVHQAENERNYHVFYQLCAAAAADPDLTSKYKLLSADEYHYLNQSTGQPATIIPGMDDAHEWDNTITAMEVLGISKEVREDITRVLAGILHLGNIRFTGSDESSSVENTDVLEIVASQFGTDPAALEKAMCMRNRGNAKESVYSNNGVKDAAGSRDAFAKALYSLLFDWLIGNINTCLSKGIKADSGSKSVIGVLDIFGFESFEHNSYEQLCINYCNEKLQGHFNEHIFKLEQEAYKKEGVDVSQIQYADNGPVLAALEKKGTGILSILDEENRLPRGSDEGFLKKVHDNAKAHPDIVKKPDMKSQRNNKSGARDCFTVVHYAGEVSYDTHGFLEKNKDTLLQDLQSLGSNSKFKFLAKLFSGGDGSKRGGAANKKTIGAQFKEQLGTLMKTLNTTEPHYIRCVKPNSAKKNNMFMAKMCLEQLRYAGLLEVCRIRQTGYPVRKTFSEFVHRYSPLGSGGHKKPESLANALQDKGILKKGEWQIGNTKVFLRTSQFEELEAARDASVSVSVIVIQRIARGFVQRKRYRSVKSFLKSLEKAIKSRNPDELEKVLLKAGVLPHQGRHLPLVQDAKKLLDRLYEERRVEEMLRDAINALDKNSINAAVSAAEDIGMGSNKLVSEAKGVLKTIEKQKEAQAELRKAADRRSLRTLENAIKNAKKLEMEGSSEYKDASAIKQKLEDEAKFLVQLEKAVKKKDIAEIKDLLPTVAELGLSDHPTAKKAQEVAKTEATLSANAEKKMKQVHDQLVTAIDKKDVLALEELSIKAIELGIKGAVIEEANKLRVEMQGRGDVIGSLTAKMKALEIRSKSHDGISESDIKPLSAAIQFAADSGIDKSEEEMSEAIRFEERMFEQIKVQKQIEKALNDGCVEKLNDVIVKIQALGIQTGAAKRVAAELRDQEASKTDAQLKEAQKIREANGGQLKEANPEEKLKEALLRTKSANSAKRSEVLQAASDNNLYGFEKYYRVRTDEDFTEYTSGDQKASIAGKKLKYQAKPISKSILDLDADLSKLAVQNHRAILQYTGDLSNSFPSSQAAYVLNRGQETPELADEIYIQLMKHLTENKRFQSEDRGWLLLSMCAHAFAPSQTFSPFVFNFLVNKRSSSGLIGNYAQYCIVELSGTLEIGSSLYRTSSDTIDSYFSRPPLLASISKFDGTNLDIPVAPDDDVQYVLKLVNKTLAIPKAEEDLYALYVNYTRMRPTDMDLRTRLIIFYKKWNPAKLQYVDYFATNWQGNEEALFVTLEKKYGPEPTLQEALAKGWVRNQKKETSKFLRLPVSAAKSAVKRLGLSGGGSSTPAPSPESPWPLPWWAFMGDVYVRMNNQSLRPVFSHKRLTISKDEKMNTMLFEQTRQNVRLGALAITKESDLAMLTAIDLQIENGGKKVRKSQQGRSQVDTIVSILPQSAIVNKSPHDWGELVSEAANKSDLPRSVSKLQTLYYDICRKATHFGMTMYLATEHQGSETLTIGVNKLGIHIFDQTRQKVEKIHEFGQIQKFGATGNHFWMLVVNKNKPSERIYYRTLTPWSIYSTIYSITASVAASKKK